MSLTERKKMSIGLAHLPTDPELADLRIKNKELLFEFNYHTYPSDKAKKAELLTKILGKAGKDPHINSPFACDYGCFIEVGDNFFANYNCVMLDNGGIKIGDNVVIAAGSIVTKDIPADSLALGVPCKTVRKITEQDREFYQRTFMSAAE